MNEFSEGRHDLMEGELVLTTRDENKVQWVEWGRKNSWMEDAEVLEVEKQ